jgi:hypothetical protein
MLEWFECTPQNRFLDVPATPGWRNMYGPPPNCKKNWVQREQFAKMYPASEWRIISGRMMMIRACLSLLIARVVKDLVYVTGFQAHRLTVFSSPIPLQTSAKRILTTIRLVGKDKRLVCWVIVVPARQNSTTEPGRLIGGRHDHDIACRSGFQSTDPIPQTRAFRSSKDRRRSTRSMGEGKRKGRFYRCPQGAHDVSGCPQTHCSGAEGALG